MGERDRSWRLQFGIGVASGLIGLMCLGIAVPNNIGALGIVASVLLLAAAVLLISALWGYLARKRA
jgi:hypothetical protein